MVKFTPKEGAFLKSNEVCRLATASKEGSSVVFNVTAAGLPPLTFQWYVNTSSNYSGAAPLTDGNGYSGSGTAS